LRHALTRMSREAERREPERAAGLLSERWTRELSNDPSEARLCVARAATTCYRAQPIG